MTSLSSVLRLGPAAALLSACGERNTYQPPPPAEVSVAKPEQRKVTLYMEVTGSTAPFNHVDLVARVQGFLDKVGYKDGAAVKKGDLLFQIDKRTTRSRCRSPRRHRQQQEALLMQADADLKRKQDLVKTSAVSVAQVDESRAKRDSTLAALAQAKGQVAQAQRNLAYTTIVAPFDGIVSARLVDPGAMVGAGEPTKLATIVQVMPIYVKFNIDEQQVLSIREKMRIAGVTLKDSGRSPSMSACRPSRAIRTPARSTTSRRRSIPAPARWPAAPCSRTRMSCCSRASSCACASPSRGGRIAARARHRARQQPAGPLPADRQR